MTGSVVDMAPFWWEIAAPAALAVLLAAGYVLAAWRRPALRTPIMTFRGWRMTREILSDPAALAEITAARDEIARGDVVRGKSEHGGLT